MASTRQKLQAHRELFELRRSAGLSRRDLARRIGISAETVRKAERGSVPGIPIQKALAGEFGKRPSDLWPFESQRIAA